MIQSSPSQVSEPSTDPKSRLLTRRKFLYLAGGSTLGLGFYAGEIARHETEVVRRTIRLDGLPGVFEGFKILQLSDIHLEEFTEAFYLKEVIHRINTLQPDMVALTGDYVSNGPLPRHLSVEFAHRCAELLTGIDCGTKCAVLGNHDAMVNPAAVTEALVSRGIPVLANRSMAIERDGQRIWIAGLEDAVAEHPNLSRALPRGRDAEHEPLILLAHEPDIASRMVNHRIGLMLSGHTHGGQIRIPFMKPLCLPYLGQRFIEGHFLFGDGMQLYVNRGIGTVGVPFRFRCPPELTLLTLAQKETQPVSNQ